ncbi:phosphatase [Dictyobacter alpinus]|uniref:Phosphatase n=1 Tax=Dictyobacter alpinus TaxID=2014873 RepID=A0A402BI77_9CHLR|nr:histidine phosphatase family protein [Dictyobacter alpinus]GCE31104.1 phosphatase [Dictyobacter alpinus]
MATTKTTMYITRHGQTEWNAERRMQGHTDSPLTALGVQQASWLHDALKDINFSAIYASPLLRAYRTAEIIRGARPEAVIPCDELKEIALGTWEGHLGKEIEKEDPAEFLAFWKSPQQYQAHNGGETFAQVRARAVPKVEELLATHAGETILLVTHAVTLKTILSEFDQRPLELFWEPPFIHPTSLSKIVRDTEATTIELYADISHYQDKEK